MKFKAGATLGLRVGRTKVCANARGPRGAVWAAEGAFGSTAELPDLIGRLATECDVRCTRMKVTLEHPPVQLRTLADLPPVGATELATLVAHHVSRFFRTNGAPLVTNAVWVGAKESRAARAAAVEESLVESIAAGARAAGLTLDIIMVADSAPPLVLLPGRERAARDRDARRHLQFLGAAATGVWALVAALFIARLAWERRAVERELTRLEAPLAAVLAARREMHAVEEALNAIAGAARDRSRALSLFAAVTAALPDSSVLTSFTWQKDGSTILSGVARQVTGVASRLNRVPGLAAPQFDGPVVRETIAGRNWERFTIVFGRDGGSGRIGGL